MEKKNYKIAIASGKGGTGKTTLAINLAWALSKKQRITLVDCDVEEPNDNLFLNGNLVKQQDVTIDLPIIDHNKCVYCGKCHDYCAYNAIMFIKSVSFLKVLGDLCHGCGACSYACRYDAIKTTEKKLGTVSVFDITQNLTLVEGRIEIGIATVVPVINKSKKTAQSEHLLIYDAPPGTSCPAVETISESDFVLLAAEPTPFGVNDLKLTVEAIRKMDKKLGVVINKAGIGDNAIYKYLEDENIPILAEIPFNKTYANKIAEGRILAQSFHEIEESMHSIFNKIKTIIES